MNHKRKRPKRQRAGCVCGSKQAKQEASGIARGSMKVYGSRGSALRLRVRAQDTE